MLSSMKTMIATSHVPLLKNHGKSHKAPGFCKILNVFFLFYVSYVGLSVSFDNFFGEDLVSLTKGKSRIDVTFSSSVRCRNLSTMHAIFFVL